MLNILGMNQEQLLGLHPDSLHRPGDPPRLLTPEEVVYMAETLGALWRYDYEALEQGRPGLHAELKSGLHSDGFFVSKILLEPWNIRLIIADQMGLRFRELMLPPRYGPEWVAGIPDGATELGKNVAGLMGLKVAEMKKEDGRIGMVSQIPAGQSILLVEDFCTRGTGFVEAAQDIASKNPGTRILPFELVIINRGGLDYIKIPVANSSAVKVVPVVNYRVKDWTLEECPLCKAGSKAIKPKATDDNWRAITSSQRKELV